ncbi:hypothetical protein ABT354_05605 [Streptomyces sp. NPDC000594]|uniref:hypothetical protein n=1 Tax=Streptomyces sp. NPDC000594 TaxID=3154261 RepID=UPI0033219BB4
MKSHTPAITGPRPAEPAPTRAGGGAPKVAARQGVPSAVRPDPRPADGRWIVATLHIVAPGRGTIPTATSRCACGRDRSAVGQRRVLELIADHTTHRTACPLRADDRSAAA